MKRCVLATVGNDNTNGNPNNTIFIIKDTKLYVPVITLSGNDNQKLSNSLSKGFERSVYWNEYKTKRENKNTKKMTIGIFSNQVFLKLVDHLH